MKESEINFIKNNNNRLNDIKKKYFIKYKKNEIRNWYNNNNNEIDYVLEKILWLLDNNESKLNIDLENFYSKLIVYIYINSFDN